MRSRDADTPRDCPGPVRRDILKLGMLSAFGLGLDDLFRARAAQSHGGSAQLGTSRAKSCILIWLAGGPSHIDTFDPKPDAASDVRGEFKPIDTTVPGLQISEVFPTFAQRMDKVTLVRGMTSPEADHDRAAHHLLTGYRPSPSLVYPSYGSVVARVRGFDRSTLPPYTAIPDAPLFSSSGYLTPAFDPFGVNGDPNAPGFRVRDLTPPDQLTLARLNRRRGMVARLDDFARRDVADTPLTTSRDRFSAQAYDLLTSTAALDAFKIESEPAELRDKYGRTTLGQSCLLARRLVQAGVSFVTVNDRGANQLGWDTHAQNFPMIKDTLAPPIDQGVAALLDDLAQLGLLDETLVLMMGEFGRTPKINGMAGRDHHGRSNCLILAGAGIPGGQVVGRTDAQADAPADRPVTPSELAATVYTLLGIDPKYQFETPDGQPIRLVNDGTPMPEILGA